jgi:glycosyltransferase involved in cell wall biosynthesis
VIRRLLTVGHSYVVSQNRRLAHEIARASGGRWEVTVGAPERLPGDLGPIVLDVDAVEPCAIAPLGMRLARSPHLRFFDRRLRDLMANPWHVVHAWQEPYVAAGAQIVASAPKAARVVFASFQNISKRYPPPIRLFERSAVRRADGWIAFGRTVHDTLIGRDGYAARPSRIIPPGVDTLVFHPDPAARVRVRNELGFSPGDPVVGYLGRFVPEKGIATLLEALPDVRAPWKAVFVGGGPLEPRLRAFERAYSGRVRVVTAVAHDDVPRWLNGMDVLCAPSRTTPRWREQFGRMLIEAMACGVPVVASRSGEIPHVVGDAGLLASEDAPAEWARILESILHDADTRRAHRDRGLARVHERYAWPVVAREHLAFFESLLG